VVETYPWFIGRRGSTPFGSDPPCGWPWSWLSAAPANP